MPTPTRALSPGEFERLKVSGIKVNYYIVCPRKLWLFSHDLRMEATSDRVALGKFVHERSYQRLPRREVLIDSLIRVDIVEGTGRVLEVKYSQRMKEAARMQVLYYLYYLKRRGATNLVGELRFPRERRREEVALTGDAERSVEKILREIREVEMLPTPPTTEFMPICRTCAYAELCWG